MLSKNVFLPRQPGDVGPKDYGHQAKEKAGGVLSSFKSQVLFLSLLPALLFPISATRKQD